MALNYLTLDGVPSTNYGVGISGVGVYDAPERDTTNFEVPGRNGDLIIDNGRFRNVPITYPAFIVRDFANRFNAFKEYLNSKKNYMRLEDTYDTGHYRLAHFKSALTPSVQILHRTGEFNIEFDCDPRRFLKIGENPIEITSQINLRNPTCFEAKPFIRAYGTGTINIDGDILTVTSADEYTDIDCERMDAYKGNVNCNGNITLSNGEFPILPVGNFNISITGFSKIILTPNWWTI